jgi:long-chain acyl-CoA synthetase
MPGLSDEDRRHWHTAFGFPSIGSAVPHARLAVLDPATGTELEAGTRGELAVRGSIVMREYAGRPDATADAFRDGWFHTGDEGFWRPGPGGSPVYFITGRLKELIIRGGHNISPFEIDEVLRSHPSVRFALAIPFQHHIYGEEIAAYVVPDGPLDQAELLAHCAARLDFAHQPKVVIFGDDVPYTATGKAKRLELAQRLAGQLDALRDTTFHRPVQAGKPEQPA